MRRVLIVTASYYPALLADTHRARLLAPELKNFGWEAEVLAAGLKFQRPDAIESDSSAFFDHAIPVHFAEGPACSIFSLFNMRSIGWRAFVPMFRQGNRLLSTRKFDLIYLSTTQFNLFYLGILWQRRFKVPFLLDFHDPWRRAGRKYLTTKHRLKRLLTDAFASWLEKTTITRASGVVAVSPNYLRQLDERYQRSRALRSNCKVVIPFAASSRDLQAVPSAADDSHTIAYVGAGGPIMEKSWRGILAVVQRLNEEGSLEVASFRFRFYGTEAFWSDSQPKYLVEIAHEYGLGSMVEEHPRRISYRRAVEIIQSCSGLIILGVDDPAYMPSKLFLYAMTGKPLLVSLHRDSQANNYFRETEGLGHLIHFEPGSRKIGDDEENEVKAFFGEAELGKTFSREQSLRKYLASNSAKLHAELFDRVLSK